MDNILEIIFTLVFGFFWLFGSSFFKNRDSDESTPSKQDSHSEASDHETRQAEIRAMILRKIAERRQQKDSEPVITFESDPYYEETYEESFEPQETVNEPLMYSETAEEETSETSFFQNSAGTPYEDTMQERLREIEATKRKAEALRKKAKQVKQDHYKIHESVDPEPGSALFVGSVRSSLKNLRNARAAFIYGEVLGKPVSLRKSSEIGSGI